MPTAKKAAEIDLIEQRLRDSTLTILVDYRGLNVAEIGTLRSQLRPTGAELRIVKNTLTRIALGRVGIQGLDELLVGPTAITFTGEDISGPAKILADFARTSRILTLKGALLGKSVLSAEQTGDVAALPSKSSLRAQLAGNIQGSLVGFVGLLNGALSSIVYTLEARAQQQQEAA